MLPSELCFENTDSISLRQLNMILILLRWSNTAKSLSQPGTGLLQSFFFFCSFNPSFHMLYMPGSTQEHN